jgi:[acyl-carrier-protein] S-malonyltransferase
MRPAAERLRERLDAIEVKHPAVPVVHNRYVETFDDPARIKLSLIEQLDHPVRWTETVQWLTAHGVEHFVECAPEKVLARLVKRITGGVEITSIQDSAALAAAIARG